MEPIVERVQAQPEELGDERWLEPMRQALEEEYEADVMKEEQKELDAYILRMLEVPQLASSSRRFADGKLSGKVAKQGLWMIQALPRRRFL